MANELKLIDIPKEIGLGILRAVVLGIVIGNSYMFYRWYTDPIEVPPVTVVVEVK